MAIMHFRSKALQELFTHGRSKKVGARYAKNTLMILDFLEAVAEISDCQGVKDFHELKGARKGTYSMHVTGNYCVTFQWDGKNVREVDFEDYH